MKKKIIALLLVLTLAFSCVFVLASCGKKGDDKTDDPKKTEANVDEDFDKPSDDTTDPSKGNDITPDDGKTPPAEDDDEFIRV